MEKQWGEKSWQEKERIQMPTYPNTEELKDVKAKLRKRPPLIFAGGVRNLKKELAEAGRGERFVIQGGDCAESFDSFDTQSIKATFAHLLQMTAILMFKADKRVCKIGRMAGQFAKPRSSDVETRDGVSLPSYRGDIINGYDFNEESRIPDPKRMLEAYNQSASTLNFIRSLAVEGYADLHLASKWLLESVKNSPAKAKYQELASDIETILDSLSNGHVMVDGSKVSVKEADFYVSHEALLLDYEEPMVRIDSLTGEKVDTSGHFLWIGNRTRQPNGAHVEFLKGIINPIGIKCGSSLTPDELKSLIKTINPDNEEGKITLIARFGKDKIREDLPPLINAVKEEGLNVTWISDPMHGNGKSLEDGTKTRFFSDILEELEAFFEVCQENGAIPAGMHLEMTGKEVTECIGGSCDLKDLSANYETKVDPRLNNEQALEMAFDVAEIINKKSNKKKNIASFTI
ncbi:MAG: 3-deoxy-7-phosphoheptulonate synthase [Alphaproteobacteria bacterium]|jgi:3-deoxy-7-phosphoheptulonate synthase|nr:3-deoxy-7-phosphoheptulonate synthase [Alphaproteobacteria bacterium]